MDAWVHCMHIPLLLAFRLLTCLYLRLRLRSRKLSRGEFFKGLGMVRIRYPILGQVLKHTWTTCEACKGCLPLATLY